MNEDPTRFSDASSDVEGADVVIVGVPYDGGMSYRGGARMAPADIRRASQSIETFSPRLRRDLEDVSYADAGDLDLTALPPERVMRRIAEAVIAHAIERRFVICLGGDHSISIGTTAGTRGVYEGLGHVVFDAHFDLRASYDGSEFSHACGTRHMAAGGPTVALGIRSGARQEFVDAEQLLVGWSEGLELPAGARALLVDRPVHLSIDLDVLDPSILPGTGNPEPAGASYRALREALLSLTGLNVVAVDVCEVAPPLDPSGVSSVVAAELVREIILAFRGGK